MRRTDALIVGGGPAGAAAAITLAARGRAPLLLERSREPHDVVCGGFLGWDTLSLLDRMGIDAGLLGAHPIHMLRLIEGARAVELDLPFAAAGISRRALDAALIALASGRGTVVERGISARSVDPASRVARLSDGSEVGADALFLASGKVDLRGAPRRHLADGLPIGLRVRIDPSPAMARTLQNRIELFLFRAGYAGLLLQEDGSVNFCLTVGSARFAGCGGKPGGLIAALTAECPLLGERLQQAHGEGGWSAIARLPYGWRTGRTVPGLFRLGDQAAVIPSIVGDGIAIALASGRAAADAYLASGAAAAPSFQRRFARSVALPVSLASLIRAIGERPALARAALPFVPRYPAMARLVARLARIGGY